MVAFRVEGFPLWRLMYLPCPRYPCYVWLWELLFRSWVFGYFNTSAFSSGIWDWKLKYSFIMGYIYCFPNSFINNIPAFA
jgi:hypothetical protein